MLDFGKYLGFEVVGEKILYVDQCVEVQLLKVKVIIQLREQIYLIYVIMWMNFIGCD